MAHLFIHARSVMVLIALTITLTMASMARKSAIPVGRFEKPSRFVVWADSVRLFSNGGGDGAAAGLVRC